MCLYVDCDVAFTSATHSANVTCVVTIVLSSMVSCQSCRSSKLKSGKIRLLLILVFTKAMKDWFFDMSSRVVSPYSHTHTHPFNGPFSGTTGWAGTRKVKPIWILLKQETVSGSGISWAIFKSAPRSRQITTPAPHHSVFLHAGCPSCCPTNSVKALKHSPYSFWHNWQIVFSQFSYCHFINFKNWCVIIKDNNNLLTVWWLCDGFLRNDWSAEFL